MSEPESRPPHILVVDDEHEIRRLVGEYLKGADLRVTLAESAAAARRLLGVERVDLIVLDVMMPGEDGLSLCRHLRETDGPPVILLTARSDDADRIVGLELGADDYLPKPFNPRELLARIRAVLRRLEGAQRPEAAKLGERVLFGPWTLQVGQRELVGADGVVVPLSTGEFRLLVSFLERPRLVLSREQLLDITQGRDAEAFDRSIDNQVSRLRKKIEEDPANPRFIKTVWGGGYQFVGDVERRK
ncbi:MAG: response regulator [Phenylobacterium sp.]|nr:response regulator [Phenylobacterium sp.]